MSSFSEFYANSYDQIHANKNYTEETSRLVSFINENYSENVLVKILDFGCGTGGHLQSLAKTGRVLSGFDISVDMLEVAKQKTTGINFTDDLDDLDSDFDLVYSLFDVINYQISKDSLRNFVNGVAAKLRPGGYFICDGWNLVGYLQEAGFKDISFMDGKSWEDEIRSDSWRFVFFAKKMMG